MESKANEWGAGGKIQRRTLRRLTLTPYQRPPSAQRRFHRLEKAAGSGSGWLSKLVDPAARFITGSATRFFSSVFCKRLTASEEDQDESCEVRVDVPELLDKVPAESPGQKVASDQLKNSEKYGISEIEQLIKQKTYTRDEVDHLIELIHSRVIEPLELEPENNKAKFDVSEDGNAMRSSTNLLTAATSLTIPEDVAASPAEIAKAYMSSRFPKVAYSAIGLPTQDLLWQDKKFSSSGPFAVTPHHQAIAPRSVVRSGRLSGAGYYTPRTLRRSAMCMMSRSPHLKVDSSADAKWSAFKAASNAGFAPSQLTMGSTLKSDCKQALKRGSSVLDSDHGSLGPIRRVRQKFGLFSGAEGAQLTSSSLRGSLLQFDKDGLKVSASSRSLQFKNAAKDDNTNQQFTKDGDNNFFSSPVLGYSHNTTRKIFEQLEIFAPPENKLLTTFVSRDESPSKLTADMLDGRVLNDLEFVDKPLFASVNANGTSDFIKEKVSKNVTESRLEKQEMVEENGSSKQDILDNMLPTAAGLNKNTKFSVSSADTTISFPAKILTQRNKAFQMSAPEDLLELDDQHENGNVPPLQSSPGERIVVPEFIFGSRSFDRLLFSSAAYVASDTLGMKDAVVPEFSFASRSTARLLFSKAATVCSGPYLICPTSGAPELLNAGTSVSSLVGTSICSGTNSRGSSFGGPPFLSSKSNGISSLVSAAQQPSILGFSAASNTSHFTVNGIGDTVSSMFGVQLVQSGSDSSLSQSSTSHLCSQSSSSMFGLNSTASVVFGSSSSSSTFELSSCKQGSSNMPFNIANRSKSFGSVSGFSVTSSGASASSTSGFPFTSSTGISSFTPLFSSNNSANSSNGLSCLTGSSSSSSGFYLVATAAASSLASSNFSLSATSSKLNSSSLGSNFPSSGSSSTGFSFGHAALVSGVTHCSTSVGSIFGYTSSGTNMSLATSVPISAVPNVWALTSISYNNEPMSVEDTMDDDKNTAPAPVVPTFIQSNAALASQSFAFGSSVFDGKSLFQFGSHQNPSIIQNSNPFQASGKPDFVPGGNFSLGSGGGEKSARRIVKVKRDKNKLK